MNHLAMTKSSEQTKKLQITTQISLPTDPNNLLMY